MTRRLLTLLAAAALAIGHPRASQSALAQQQPQAEPARPSSFTLIDRALEAKTIDAETAHKYRVFAAFGDTRLPAALRGDDTGMRALPPSVAEVGALLATFSAATRAELEPFFMRPAEPGSWVTLATVGGQEPGAPNRRQDVNGSDRPALEADPSTSLEPGVAGSLAAHAGASSARPAAVAWTWKWVHAVGGKAKVWWQDRYPTDAAIAQGLASQLTARIWPELTRLMNQEPLPDNGIIRNGGDAALDFYLVHSPANVEWVGLTDTAVDSVPCHPARFIKIDTRTYGLGSEREYGVLQIATHELMHAITFAYRVRHGCLPPWIGEASADWASNWLYPLTDGEHNEASIYMNSVQVKIDNPGKGGKTGRYYGEHLLPYFLQQATGGTDFMPRMWTNFKTMDVFAGIDAVVPGRFEKFWPKFLVRLWNRQPVDAPDGFRQWDRIPVGPIPTGGLDIVEIRAGTIETRSMNFVKANIAELVFEDGVQPMAGHYRWFRFEPSVRSVLFRNTIREQAILHGTVWGIEKIGGTWKQPVDWTEELQKAWCRDVAAENIEELVLIFGNHDWRTFRSVNPTEEPTVEGRGIGCNGWIGTATLINTITSTDPALTIVETLNTSLHFAIDTTLTVPGQPPEYWKSVTGNIRWRVQVTGTCTGSASGSVMIPDRDDHPAVLRIWSEGGKMHHSGGNGVWPGDQPYYTITCPNGPSQMTLFGALGYFATDGDRDELAADGKSFQGSFTNSPAPGLTVSHRYSFRCDRGC